jgi:SAM-dependent methyltransferase
MLEWTGERFLPWIRESTIAYEHLHRYAYATTLAKDKRVLDLACGEGYGSNMLASAAASVVGIDIDQTAIQHASDKYASKTLRFLTGSISSVPIPDNHSFDVIVCFEAIEHVEDHEKLLGEVKRLLKPDGVFLVSTPNKVVYHDESEAENPFHVKELYFEEFQQLLERHFQNIRFLGQRIHPSSSIWPIGSHNADGFQEFVLQRGELEFQLIPKEERVARYFIAVASDSAGVLPVAGSVLIDQSDGLIKEKDEELRGTKAAAGEAIHWREQQIQERAQTISSLEDTVKWREGQISQLTQGLEWTRNRVTEMETTIASHEEALAWRAHQVEDLENEKTALAGRLQNTQRRLETATEQLEAIYASSDWKFILRLRHLRDRLAPSGTARRKFLQKLIGLGKSRA